MKFRRLSNEELQELEGEFIKFLAANTVTAVDWVQIKTHDVSKAEMLIDLFSDIVLEKVLKKVRFVEHRSERELIVFKCEEAEMEMIGLNVSDALDVDLTNEASVVSMLLNSEMLDGNVKAFFQKKPYTKNREEEVFDMIESGCFITNDTIYNTLKGLYL